MLGRRQFLYENVSVFFVFICLATPDAPSDGQNVPKQNPVSGLQVPYPELRSDSTSLLSRARLVVRVSFFYSWEDTFRDRDIFKTSPLSTWASLGARRGNILRQRIFQNKSPLNMGLS